MHQGYPPDLAQLQAVMNAIEIACSSIQVYHSFLFLFIYVSEIFCKKRTAKESWVYALDASRVQWIPTNTVLFFFCAMEAGKKIVVCFWLCKMTNLGGICGEIGHTNKHRAMNNQQWKTRTQDIETFTQFPNCVWVHLWLIPAAVFTMYQMKERTNLHRLLLISYNKYL